MSETLTKFGRLGVSLDKGGAYAIDADRVALSEDNVVLLASVLGDTGTIKGIRAVLNADVKAYLSVEGIETRQAGETSHDYWSNRSPSYAKKDETQYLTFFHRLPFGMAHAVFVSKRPGFLPVGTPTRIWKELMDNRFTTPMLRGWMPYIVEQLRAKDLLRDAWCYRCQSVLLTATTEDLDQIVTEGVASGALAIDQAATAAA